MMRTADGLRVFNPSEHDVRDEYRESWAALIVMRSFWYRYAGPPAAKQLCDHTILGTSVYPMVYV